MRPLDRAFEEVDDFRRLLDGLAVVVDFVLDGDAGSMLSMSSVFEIGLVSSDLH